MDAIFGNTLLPKICTNDTFRCMKPDNSDKAIARACAVLGSQLALAVAIGAAPAQVSQWVNGIRPVPAHYCLAIERATQGAVTRQDLRPDDAHLIWPDIKAPKRKAA